VRFRVSIAIGGILLLLGAAATAPATTTARPPTRVTIVAPRLAQPGEIVRVDGRVIGGSSIVAPALFRVSEAGSTIRRKFIRIHESRFRTWTRFSKPGVYRVSVFYPGDSGSGGGSGHLPSSATVKIRVT
jgi:hypothetical protein